MYPYVILILMNQCSIFQKWSLQHRKRNRWLKLFLVKVPPPCENTTPSKISMFSVTVPNHVRGLRFPLKYTLDACTGSVYKTSRYNTELKNYFIMPLGLLFSGASKSSFILFDVIDLSFVKIPITQLLTSSMIQ